MAVSGWIVRVTSVAAMTAAVVFGLAALSLAQVPRPPARQGGPAGTTPAELQRMFDAYALIQAQEQLGIDDEHYPQFLARFKALQDVRQKSLAERSRRLAELRRLANKEAVDEGQIEDRLSQLAALDERTFDDVRDAYAKIDQVLTVRQRAKFRIFEEQMERQKIDLLLRARQANRRQTPQ
jgi:Spy/CpxP family protein refolding chaperone